jgi:hypothetical protein
MKGVNLIFISKACKSSVLQLKCVGTDSDQAVHISTPEWGE